MTIEGWQIVADVIGHVAWPLLVAALIAVFHKPLYAFLVDAEEAGWGNAKVKRGNLRSQALKEEATDHGPGLSETDETDRFAEPPDISGSVVEIETAGTASVTLRYYGRVTLDRLRGSKHNTDTTSSRLGGEIVGSTYAELKQAVRMVAFLLQVSGGLRGRLPSLPVTLDALALPDDLDADIREARQFAVDVTDRTLKVDGQGASDYIDSVRALVERLIVWGVARAGQSAESAPHS